MATHTLPPAGSVLEAFHADKAHTGQFHDDPQSVFQSGLLPALPGDKSTSKRYGYTQAEADLAFTKSGLDGWTSPRADFDYWTMGPSELRWASQIYQVGREKLATERGLDPEIAETLYAWTRWLASWKATFPAGTKLPTASKLAGLKLVQPK